MANPRNIAIVEVGPRDGLQNEAASVPTEVKIEFIRRAVDAGIRRIEVASFVSPRRVPQMADAEAILKALPRRDDVTLRRARAEPRGLRPRRARPAAARSAMVVFTTDEFNRRNQGVTSAESVRIWREIRGSRQRRRDPHCAGHDLGRFRLPHSRARCRRSGS